MRSERSGGGVIGGPTQVVQLSVAYTSTRGNIYVRLLGNVSFLFE